MANLYRPVGITSHQVEVAHGDKVPVHRGRGVPGVVQVGAASTERRIGFALILGPPPRLQLQTVVWSHVVKQRVQRFLLYSPILKLYQVVETMMVNLTVRETRR